MTTPGFTREELAAEKKSEAYSLALQDAARQARFTSEQRKLILQTCCGGASEQEAAALIAIAEQRGLNPITGECYFVKRYDTQKQQSVWAVQASIDAFRIKADETGLYDGQDEPEYEYDDKGALKLARVKVYRKGWARPSVGVARLSEYEQKTKEGGATRFWRTMPHTMLAKCAEALAMRKAFPRHFAGIYTGDEMAQAQNDAPAHDVDTGEVSDTIPAPTTSQQLTEMHLQRIANCVTLDDLRQAGEAIKADAPRMGEGDVKYLRGMAKGQKDKINALGAGGQGLAARRSDTEPAPPDALKDAAL